MIRAPAGELPGRPWMARYRLVACRQRPVVAFLDRPGVGS
jgi:hypothetical protein